MNSSKFYQKNGFKIALSCILFLVFTGLITCFFYFPYRKPFTTDHNYTMVFSGASIFTRGIIPEVVDEKTGESSYVLATKGAPLSGRYRMVNAALDNEHIETVVIEASYYTLIKHLEDYTLDEKLLYVPKVMGLNHKMETAASVFSFWDDEYDQIYAETVYEGVQVWYKYILMSDYDSYLANRGFTPYEAHSQKIKNKEKAEELYNAKEIDTNYPQDVIAELEDLIRLCQAKGKRVILLTMPMSQKCIWHHTGWDTYRQIMCEIADRYHLDYYDFNLMEDIGVYLDDSTAWHDKEHLSEAGARVFSPVVGEVLNACLRDLDPGYHFYSSYEEAKEHSVYQEYFQ